MAQINTRKRNGKWEYRFEIAGMDGKRKQKSKGGYRTKAEALKAGTQALNLYNNAGVTNESKEAEMSVRDCMEAWYESYVKMNLGLSSQKAYRSLIDNHIIPTIGKYRMNSVTFTALQGLIDQKSASGFKESTLTTIKAILKGFFRYEFNAGLIYQNPAQNIYVSRSVKKNEGKISTPNVKAYTREGIDEFEKKLQNKLAWYPFIIGYYTGMRAGEIFALTWEDIDLENRAISITKTILSKKKDSRGSTSYVLSSPKNDSSSRTIKFGESLEAVFRRFKTQCHENEMLYGAHYTRIYANAEGRLYERFKSESVEDGLKNINLIMRRDNGCIFSQNSMYSDLRKLFGGEFRFHNLRHTHATILVEAGVSIKEVQTRLGHSTIVTTLDKYAESTEKMEDTAVSAMDAWAK